MQGLNKIGASVLLLLLTNCFSIAQINLPSGSQFIMLRMTSGIADMDSSLQLDSYSLTQRRDLLNKLYQTDQRYRDSLVNGSRSTIKQQLYTHKVVANDQANQVLLNKLVTRFGWPTRQQYGDQGTFIAWLIVWHAKPSYQKRYYLLIKKAYQQGLIRQSPGQLGERMKRFSSDT